MTTSEADGTAMAAAVLRGDAGIRKQRETHCDLLVRSLRDVSGWLALDAFLGAGDRRVANVAVEPGFGHGLAEPSIAPQLSSGDRYTGFRAISLIAQIAGELATASWQLIESSLHYGASALIRQLLECEYLFEAIRQDFGFAASWWMATEQEQWDFRPNKLRNIGDFSTEEYKSHCNAGGHPNPEGAYLLELEEAMSQITIGNTTSTRPVVAVVDVLMIDFVYHLDRIWKLEVELLSTHHARFAEIRSGLIEEVAHSENRWREKDPTSDITLARRLASIYEQERRS
jgi:hypothetical protein